MFVRLCDLHNMDLFLKTGGNGDRDVEGEGEQQMFLRFFIFVCDTLSWVPAPRCLWFWQS